MITTLLAIIWYDGASPADTVAPSSNAYDSAAPPIGAFAFFDQYGESAIVVPPVTNPIDGARRVRGRAKQKRILSEQQRDKEYLEQQTPKPVAKKTAPPVAEPKPAIAEPKHVQASVSLPALVETKLAAPTHSPVAAPRDLVAEADFKLQYWSRFFMLVIDNLHKH